MSLIKILVSTLVCLIVLSANGGSEVPATTFAKKVEGLGRVSAAVQTTDGSYVSISDTGDTYTSFVVRKISNVGKRIWERALSFQVLFDGFVFMNGIAETTDGFVLVGWGRLGGYYSIEAAVLVKLRTDGTVQWTKTYSAPASFDSVFATADGGYIIQANAYPPCQTVLLKFSSDNNVVLSKSFEDGCGESFSQRVSDGLILASPIFDGNESRGLRVFKVNDSGQVVWKKILKINGFGLQAVGADVKNGVVLAGKSSDSNTLILAGLNADGQLYWKASYLLEVPSFGISSLKLTMDGGYVITGTKFHRTQGNRAGVLLRINAKRNLIFQKTFGLADMQDASSIFATAEGGFTLFGSSGVEDLLILNLNSDGVVPGCGFLHRLRAKRVASPRVTRKNLEIVLENFPISTVGSIEIHSVVSRKRSSDACL